MLKDFSPSIGVRTPDVTRDSPVLTNTARRFQDRVGGLLPFSTDLSLFVTYLEEAYLEAGDDELDDVLQLLTQLFPEEMRHRSVWFRRGQIVEAVLPAAVAATDEPLLMLHHLEPAGDLAFSYEVMVGDHRYDIFHGVTDEETSRLLRVMAPDGRDLNFLNSPTVFERRAIQQKRGRMRGLRPRPAAPQQLFSRMPLDATVLIPAFADYAGLHRLLLSLATSQRRLSRLIIGFEPGPRPAELTDSIEAARAVFAEIELVEHEERQGFVGNSNALMERVTTDLFLLLTTDVELPRGWERRIFVAFDDPAVTLATPLATNGVNLTVPIPPGWNWRDMDIVLQERAPTFPDACTIIGYALAGRRSGLPSRVLFDTAVDTGYGEDSDLHYRTVQSGRRAVVIDDLLVRHDGATSFDTVDSTAELQRRNRRWFFARWSEVYLDDLREYMERGEVEAVISLAVGAAGTRTDRRLDVVFVAPLVSGDSGGVSAIFNMEDACARDGLHSAVVLTLNSHEASARHVTPFPQFDAFLNAVESVGHVVCTSSETVAAAQYLSNIYGAELVHYVQGPEVAFGGGAWAGATLYDYQAADRRIVISDYLGSYLEALGAGGAERLNYGPSTHIFFDRGAPRTERSVVLHAGDALEKGPGLAAVSASVFLNAGWSVHVIGRRAGPGWPSGVILHGQTPAWKLAELFNKTQYYVDTSMYDGLGMMMLEAAFCGSVPVTLRSGGAAVILEAYDAGILLSGSAALLDLPLSLPADYEAFRRERQRGVAALRSAVSLEAAYAQASRLFAGEARV